ncbi:hypothetical protein DMA12_06425 [Amycolatopsis balhimycina DSM 5908]|uniref:Uncharacterized protein n=1 Tax=Amycolatopsis balhimycina DSM 5908 TaxID=1081091 RepID=A0A428X0A8_AMYBA|nr:hypothetical protein [Amycolatopsis balhimycina]RSM48749.1 hypothetical protein DMA12_06425 [Amycolatopsis balhimycina DSM 5908]
MLDVVKFSQYVQTFKSTLEDEDERKFLSAILWIAWILTAQKEDLKAGFNESFTPEQADLITAYSHGNWTLPPLIQASLNTSINASINDSINAAIRPYTVKP